MKTTKPSMEVYRKVKQATGLEIQLEKHALILAISDACSMKDGVCRKSVATMSREHGIKARAFHYAIRGRQREDGTYYFQGLLARGIVTAVEREGVPTVYSISESRLDAYCTLTRAQDTDDLCQKSDDLCTIEDEPVPNESEPVPNGIQVLKAVLKENANTNATANAAAKPAQESLEPKDKDAGKTLPNKSTPVRDEEEMSIKNRLFAIASLEFGTKHNQSLKSDANTTLTYLVREHGDSTVVEDFKAWASECTDRENVYAPLAAYLAVAPKRLSETKGARVSKADPRVREIGALAFTLVKKTPRETDIIALLAEYEQKEIEEAFTYYVNGLPKTDDENFAIYPFFKDGGAHAVILALKRKKAQDVLLEASVKYSIEIGVAERRAMREAISERIRAEEELAAKLGDSPF